MPTPQRPSVSVGGGRLLSSRRGHRWLARPVVATAAVVGLVTGAFFAAGGLLVLVALRISSDQFGHPAAVGGVAGAAIVLGLGLIGGRRHVSRGLAHMVVAVGTVVITVGAALAGHTPTATLLAFLYVLIAVDAAFFFSWPGATGHLVGTLGACTWVLCRADGPGAGAAVLVCGMSVLVAAVVAWLVRMASAAETDALTGLPNRRGFDRLLDEALDTANRTGMPLTVAIADLDRLKAVNDALGHAAADQLLAKLAYSWRKVLPPTACLGRLGSDEFVVLLPENVSSALDVLEAIREATPSPLTCSIGAAQLDADDPSTFLAHADQALYEAKRGGRNRVRVHADDLSVRAAVRRAMADGELVVYYQPVVDLTTGAVRKAEALVRWRRPSGAVMPPGEFLPLIQSSDLIVDVDRFVRRTALAQVARWRAAGGPAAVTVNVTAQELMSEDFADDVLAGLDHEGLPGEALVVEVVESSLTGEMTTAIAALERLRTRGVRIAIDDFGTGYSSLSRLTRLPLDILKIDRSFIEQVDENSTGAPVVQAILGLAAALRLHVVAEGVERPCQADFLRSVGCPAAQGYLYGRPMPAEDLTNALSQVPALR